MRLQKAALTVAGVIGVGIIAIGARFLLQPGESAAGFGMAPPPATDPYLAVKGVRDIGTGLVLLALLATRQSRAVGWAMLALSVIPIGDALIVLANDGSPVAAYGIHGGTAAVALAAAGVLLLRDRATRGSATAASSETVQAAST
jgi:Domain of unknown function (DUF4267)